jgi:hypothetical protein
MRVEVKNHEKVGNEEVVTYRVSIKDHYGPEIDVQVSQTEGCLPIISPVLATYVVEDSSENIGLDKTMEEIGKYFFKKDGMLFLESRKYGYIFISSEKVEDIFQKIRNNIQLF